MNSSKIHLSVQLDIHYNNSSPVARLCRKHLAEIQKKNVVDKKSAGKRTCYTLVGIRTALASAGDPKNTLVFDYSLCIGIEDKVSGDAGAERCF